MIQMTIEELSVPLTPIEMGQLATAAAMPGHQLNDEGLKKLRRLMFAYDNRVGGMTIAELIRESHATAVSKGWWEKDRPFSEGIALMHSELSEALEEWRKGAPIDMIAINPPSPSDPSVPPLKPEGIAVELADLLIRVGDWCGKHGIPLEEALRAKMAYNKTRSFRHGGKIA